MTLGRGTAVIFGAAGGIGAALANALAARGYALALVDLDAERLDSVAAALGERGTKTSTHRCDIADRAAVARLVGEVGAAHEQVTLLANCAGVALNARIDEAKIEDVDWVLAVNFLGPVQCILAFLPALQRAPRAAIVNVLSGFAWLGFPRKGAYAAAKAALRVFSDTLRIEAAGSNLQVLAVYPGPVATAIAARGRASDPERQQREHTFLQTKGLRPERVAARIVRALERGKKCVRIGMAARALEWAGRLAPGLAAWSLGRAQHRLEF